MNDELKQLSTAVTAGLMTRRDFIARAAALGVTRVTVYRWLGHDL